MYDIVRQRARFTTQTQCCKLRIWMPNRWCTRFACYTRIQRFRILCRIGRRTDITDQFSGRSSSSGGDGSVGWPHFAATPSNNVASGTKTQLADRTRTSSPYAFETHIVPTYARIYIHPYIDTKTHTLLCSGRTSKLAAAVHTSSAVAAANSKA